MQAIKQANNQENKQSNNQERSRTMNDNHNEDEAPLMARARIPRSKTR